MDSNSQGLLFVALGIAAISYSIGMIVVTWIRPDSSLQPLFRARWRFGVKASKLGAAVQAALFLSLGASMLLAALESPLTKIALSFVGVSAIFMFYARLADLGNDSEA